MSAEIGFEPFLWLIGLTLLSLLFLGVLFWAVRSRLKKPHASAQQRLPHEAWAEWSQPNQTAQHSKQREQKEIEIMQHE